jgi:hypothetical protein
VVGGTLGGVTRSNIPLEEDSTESRLAGAGAGAISGAATGAAIGSIVPGIGTLVGGIVGGVAGGVAGSGILDEASVCVTASFGEDSEQIDIIKLYRQRRLTDADMRGYYALTRSIAARMGRNKNYRDLMTKILVEPLVQESAERLGLVYERPEPLNHEIASTFEKLINLLGQKIDEIDAADAELVQSPESVEVA